MSKARGQSKMPQSSPSLFLRLNGKKSQLMDSASREIVAAAMPDWVRNALRIQEQRLAKLTSI